MKILTIVGHQNIQYNSITSLHGNTGTVGELEINIRITDRVSAMLRERGFEVTQSDANANDDPTITKTDYSLALALHCDMDVAGDQGGGMCGSGDKSVDAMWQESLRIKKVFDEVYFSETKIVNKNIVTPGMAKYYMWQYLTTKTPCVLLEMGQAKDPHDSVLLGNTELISSAIVRSICKAFNVPYDLTPPEETCEEKIIKLNKEIEVLKTLADNLSKEVSDLTGKLAISKKNESDCQSSLESANKENQKLITELAYFKPYKPLYEKALKDQVDKYTGWQLIKMGISKLKIKK